MRKENKQRKPLSRERSFVEYRSFEKKKEAEEILKNRVALIIREES